MSAVSSAQLDKLRELYTENRQEVTLVELGLQLERYYEKYIRGPANDPLVRKLDEKELPEWRAATIIDHFLNHRTEPRALLNKRLDQVGALADQMFENGLFRVPVGVKGVPQAKDVRVNAKYSAMFMSAVQLEVRLLSQQPSQMLGFNENASMEQRVQSFVRQKHNMVSATRKRRILDTSAPSQFQ